MDDDSNPDRLPAYASLLAARHAAQREELAALVARLPVEPPASILDVPCGDGFYLDLLAAKAGDEGSVWGADISPAFLDLARQAVRNSAARVEFVEANVETLPFPDGFFDLVWCAHSLISLPDPVKALREMRRVTRANGTVAVLENDGLHDVILPWPAELELTVHDALRTAFAQRHVPPRKMYAARHLQEIFHQAGLETIERVTTTIDRTATLTEADRTFLARYFEWLTNHVDPFLNPDDRTRLHALTDPNSADYLPDSPEFEMTCLEILTLGR